MIMVAATTTLVPTTHGPRTALQRKLLSFSRPLRLSSKHGTLTLRISGEGTYGVCYSAPVGVNWNRVEIDVFFSSSQAREFPSTSPSPSTPFLTHAGGVQTFCNINCQGGASVKQQDTNCYLPTSGCAIGSL